MSGVPCRDCVSGTLSDKTPTGTETTIHGLPTYVALPEGESKGLIVYIPDAFGWKFNNNRVLADQYAKKGGFTVYLPEVMDGHAVNEMLLDHMSFITAPASWYTTLFEKPIYILQSIQHMVPFAIRCRESVTMPRVLEFVKALRTSPETANLKIGAAGFCWGGLHAVKLAHDTPSSRVHRYGSEAGEVKPLIDAAFTAHPSMLNVPTDITGVTVPLSIAVGDVDFVMKFPDVENAKSILEKKGDDHEVVVYPGAKHGFAVRGDPRDPKQKEQADQAEEQAIGWFSKWLA
ncbi:hypothetical protein VE01_01327 [Pseudogymnoascus verrucosus]|uniref:Dienelactone hydrolase domain-containing protein n=1 Tax=Pseudogymnoascus verrucosus TaxID=342668 RepID=A0A1B8GXY4_9PEZI|nr:uncharacterized protein VE01_01327 [Pseudogymnoascus verrucosus]OBU00694.1 hypothetical protein VE01_01327 [Pseudogymnoascus verrucosus]